MLKKFELAYISKQIDIYIDSLKYGVSPSKVLHDFDSQMVELGYMESLGKLYIARNNTFDYYCTQPEKQFKIDMEKGIYPRDYTYTDTQIEKIMTTPYKSINVPNDFLYLTLTKEGKVHEVNSDTAASILRNIKNRIIPNSVTIPNTDKYVVNIEDRLKQIEMLGKVDPVVGNVNKEGFEYLHALKLQGYIEAIVFKNKNNDKIVDVIGFEQV